MSDVEGLTKRNTYWLIGTSMYYLTVTNEMQCIYILAYSHVPLVNVWHAQLL